MQVLETVCAMQSWVAEMKDQHVTIALVPTMGAIHAGHLSLVETAKHEADVVVASIFVNPLQFGPGEDFERYPNNFSADAEKLEDVSVDAIFHPSVEEMYPHGPSETRIVSPRMASGLCGRTRPTHFEGVLTVVAKLFHIITPEIAVFGQKDYQQLALIRRMVRDLNFPVKIVGGATWRENSGLALSSRNVYMTEAERARASALQRGLQAARQLFAQEPRCDVLMLKERVRTELKAVHIQAEYIEVVDYETLLPVNVPFERPVVLAVAAQVGRARLIDNILIMPQ